jgi:hypothetical protein
MSNKELSQEILLKVALHFKHSLNFAVTEENNVF